MLLFYLILAHLIADFILQPTALIRWKYKSWKGVAVHALIHFGLYLLILWPFLPNGPIVWMALGIAFCHFFIDRNKITRENQSKAYLASFYLDQIYHFITLIVGSSVLGLTTRVAENGILWLKFYNSPLVVLALISLILSTYFVEIVQYQKKREKGDAAKFMPNYKNVLARALICILIFAVWTFVSILLVA